MVIVVLAFVVGSPVALMAHPGHVAHDMQNFNLAHYLFSPYHLLVTIMIAAFLWLMVGWAKRYFKSINSENHKKIWKN
jgi:hypothetical protein